MKRESAHSTCSGVGGSPGTPRRCPKRTSNIFKTIKLKVTVRISPLPPKPPLQFVSFKFCSETFWTAQMNGLPGVAGKIVQSFAPFREGPFSRRGEIIFTSGGNGGAEASFKNNSNGGERIPPKKRKRDDSTHFRVLAQKCRATPQLIGERPLCFPRVFYYLGNLLMKRN
jgi:hypothetical protein